jgi:PAS domain S-box-containing protein
MKTMARGAAASDPSAEPSIGIRLRHLALAAACVAGGIALAAAVSLHRADVEQRSIEARALTVARATVNAADREVAAAIARMEALGTSPVLRAGDLRAFHDQLAATPVPDATWLVLHDLERQILNSLRPFGAASLPRIADFDPASQAAARRVVRTREPAVSPVVWAPLAQTHIVAVTIPVVIDGAVRHLMSAILSDRRLSAVIEEQPIPPDWSSLLLDRNGHIVALAGMTERPTQRAVPAEWATQLRGQDAQGVFFGTRDGAPFLVAFARSASSDWTGLVEVPWSGANSPIQRTLLLLAGGGGLLMVAAAGTALLVARGTDRPVMALRASAAEARARQREAETRYRAYWEHANEALFVVLVTDDGRFVFEGTNPAHERLSGIASASVAGREPQECLPPTMAAGLTDALRRCVETDTPLRHEQTLALPSGERDWETNLAPVHDPASGRILRILGNAQDVTDRRRSEIALRESVERLRLAQEAAAIGTWDWDLATGAVRWTSTLQTVLGRGTADDEPPMVTGWASIIHPDDRLRAEAEMGAAIADGRPFRCEFRVLPGRDNEVRWLLSRGRVALDIDPAAGASQRVLGVAMDITERKRIEQQRDEALALFRGITETSPDIVYILDLTARRTVYANRRLAEVLGYGVAAADAMAEDALRELLHRTDASGAEARILQLRSLADGEVATGELRLRHQDGSWRWVATRETVFARDEQGAVTQIVGCANDTTDAREAEEAVRHLGGRLLTLQDDERRRIARELHDSTAQILLGASFAAERARSASPDMTADADDAIEEVLSLIEEGQREIRTLAYLLHPPLLDEMGLPAALRWFAKGFSRRSGLAISVELTPEADRRRLPHDVESALFRVAQEALGNSLRHSGGTKVAVTLAIEPHEGPPASVVLRVEDDGQGLANPKPGKAEDDNEAELFGVGLAGMRERMRHLGGHLMILAAVPSGTIIEATVPIDRSRMP